MFSECFILDCCAVIAAKSGTCASSIQVNCIQTQTKQSYPKMCFYWLLCVKVVLSVFFSFHFELVFSLQTDEELEMLSRFCHVITFFSYLVDIKEFLIFKMSLCVCLSSLFTLTRMTREPHWAEMPAIDWQWLDFKIYWSGIWSGLSFKSHRLLGTTLFIFFYSFCFFLTFISCLVCFLSLLFW